MASLTCLVPSKDHTEQDLATQDVNIPSHRMPSRATPIFTNKIVRCAFLAVLSVSFIFLNQVHISYNNNLIPPESKTIFRNAFGNPFVKFGKKPLFKYPILNDQMIKNINQTILKEIGPTTRKISIPISKSKRAFPKGNLLLGVMPRANGTFSRGYSTLDVTQNVERMTDIETTQAKYSIPSILHQMYKNNSIPSVYVRYVQSWIRNNPDFEYRFWTDASMRTFMRNFYQPFMMKFLLYRFNLERVDVMRYFLLHHYGGIYSDMDVESLRPLLPILQKHSCILAQAPKELSRLLHDKDFHVCNAFMACRPGHPFFSLLLQDLAKFSREGHPIEDVIYTTGPLVLTETFLKYRKMYSERMRVERELEIFLAPAELFLPTFDNDLQLQKFKTMCSDFSPLSKRQQFACVWLMTKNFRKERSKVSYTDHHWLHIGYSDGKFEGNTTDIFDVVPKARVSP